MSRRWSPPEFRPRVSQLRLAVAAFALVQFIAAWANPVPEREWSRMLSLPGQYLRTPSDSTRRALVWTLSQGYLDVYLQSPDTLALMVRDIEPFVPLFVAAQTRPFVPNDKLQAWFRATAPMHRAEMIHALKSWFTAGSDSIAPEGGQHHITFSSRERWLDFANVRSGAALDLADWDARELLPEFRLLRQRVVEEAREIGADPRGPLALLDRAIRRLRGEPGPAALDPDGHAGFRAGRTAADIATATAQMGRSHVIGPMTRTLSAADGKALWSMVAAARETVFAGYSGTGSIALRFEDGAVVTLRQGYRWGLLELDQYPQPTRWLHHDGLYARFLSLTQSMPPRPVVASIQSTARFRRERVLVTVDRDTVRVEGHYEFVSDGAARPFAVRFPAVEAPRAPWLRSWGASLENPRPRDLVLPRDYSSPDSGFIVFPSLPNDTVRVVASSEAAIFGRRRAVYLLTTARAWREPLDWALLEVDWPDSLGLPLRADLITDLDRAEVTPGYGDHRPRLKVQFTI